MIVLRKLAVNKVLLEELLVYLEILMYHLEEKLYFTQPIKDFVLTFNLAKNISSDLKLNSNIAKEV